ncbi:MAG: hypothetical protein KDD46_04645 [Bdellovibrionales bacterium]|nr:hypothetical protein [Bdellovibrionales bacterium]
MSARLRAYALKYEVLFFSLLFLLQRFSHIEKIFSGIGFAPPGVDPFYRMHRVRLLLENHLHFQIFDPYLNFPFGAKTPWTPGMEYLVALICKICNFSDTKDIAIVSILSVPFFSLPLILCVKPVVSRFTDAMSVRVMVYLAFTFLPVFIFFSSLGRFDHHMFEASLPLFLFILFYSDIKRIQKVIGWSVFFGLSWFFWPHAWLLHFMIIPLALYERRSIDQLLLLGLGFLGASILQAFFLWWWAPENFWSGNMSTFGISWWAPLTAFFIGLFFLEIYYNDQRRGWKKLPYRLFIVGVVSLLVFRASILAVLQSMFGGLLANSGTLGNTEETVSAFTFIMKHGMKTEHVHVFVLPFLMAYFWIKKEYRSYILFMTIPMLLYLFQIRFMTIFYPLTIILFLFGLYLSIEHGLCLKLKNQYLRNSLYIFCVLCLAFPLRSKLGHAIPNKYKLIHHVKKGSQFIDEEIKRRSYDRLQSGIGARWMFGHWIVFYANAPVVTSPFQGESALDTGYLFYSRDLKTYEEYIKKYPIKYLMLVNTPYEHAQQFHFYHPDQKDVLEYDQQKNQLVVKDAFRDLFVSEFLYDNAVKYQQSAYGPWRVVYASFQKIGLENDFSDIKIFERVQGAFVKIRSKRQNLRLLARIDIAPQEVFEYEPKPIQHDDGYVVFRIAYGQYRYAGVDFSGEYKILDENNTVLKTIVVEENDVLSGNSIQVEME